VMSGGYGDCSPCEESDTCGPLIGADSLYYWSATEFDSISGWRFDLEYGYVYDADKTSHAGSRCVRPGP